MPCKGSLKKFTGIHGCFSVSGGSRVFLIHLFVLNPGLGIPSWDGVAHAAWTRNKNRKAEVGSGI